MTLCQSLIPMLQSKGILYFRQFLGRTSAIERSTIKCARFIMTPSFSSKHYRSYTSKSNVCDKTCLKLQETLKDVNIHELFPIKELSMYYADEYDEELFLEIHKELLSLYYDSYMKILNTTDSSLKILKSRLNEMHLSLFSGNMHKMSECSKIILQVRSGVGGEESAMFASELFKMYENISHDRGFNFVKHNSSTAEITGGTEFFKYEFGVHRVQRIPTNCKRIQTSSAVVLVVPHFDIENVKLKNSDLSIETMRSTGPGGQSVNKSETAVRVLHVPTGITISVQDTSSQIDNKALAIELISQKIREKQLKELEMLRSEIRSSQVKTGDRSEKIRTLNFIHDTIIDHRCKVTLNGIESFLDYGNGIEKIHQSLSDMDETTIVKFMIDNIGPVVEYYKLKHRHK
ncbi:peptide chain release factor 1, putative [Theileria equi strain WA]|uniref:Peptide chain release factor 1, putative n=1 Tax=Theileria equi strain WA TaxID=1537102 RepID=L1LCD9_THEEQ|nr:peptide chain release factor 1, putative [Theileria equi strain WA]EKX72944.1 peptide chain release factor 1, putative [Theileria equi strain WA]|eukprot:XP_004832396.1 peptide chain release factor 1, putative [Theileria equi strain WA]